MPRFLSAPLRSIILGLFDRGGGIPEDRIRWTLDDVGSFLRHAGAKTTLLFVVTVLGVEWLPLVILGRFQRMSRLPEAVRAEYLDMLDRSRFAIMLALPKALLALVYYEHPDVLRETGYDFTCLMGELPRDVGLVQLGAAPESAGKEHRA